MRRSDSETGTAGGDELPPAATAALASWIAELEALSAAEQEPLPPPLDAMGSE